tara:strand:+ start:427 stop:648 length:222 start_codon:yes stop_codon:yes gene_type:complete
MAPYQVNSSHDLRQDGLLVNFWPNSDLLIKHTEFLWLSPAFLNIWYDIKFFLSGDVIFLMLNIHAKCYAFPRL